MAIASYRVYFTKKICNTKWIHREKVNEMYFRWFNDYVFNTNFTFLYINVNKNWRTSICFDRGSTVYKGYFLIFFFNDSYCSKNWTGAQRLIEDNNIATNIELKLCCVYIIFLFLNVFVKCLVDCVTIVFKSSDVYPIRRDKTRKGLLKPVCILRVSCVLFEMLTLTIV